MKTLCGLLVCFVLAAGMVYGQNPTMCLQDQYGNQYNFTIDVAAGYVYGTVTNAQGCAATSWPITGCLVKGDAGIGLEITAANPNADSCFSIYTLKGTLPNFQWYYDNGPGGQPGTWAACGSAVTGKGTGKGAKK